MAQIRLTEERCYELFREYETPKHVIAHCRAVCDVSVRFAEELNAKGFNFDISLVRAAGLIHDLVRLKKPHDKEGAKVLRSLGYFEEADIVEDHMGHQFPENLKDSTESDMVVLADRLVCENEFVGLERRIQYLKDKYGNIPEVNEKLDKGAIRTRMFMNQVEEVLGKSIDSLFAPGLDEILKQVEKPAQYIGGETNMVVKSDDEVNFRFAFAFPDLYEIGMSYMGMQILYKITNDMPGVYCERVFHPMPDMEEIMRKQGIGLFTLESKTPVKDVQLFGFTLQYEMAFTNVLNMIELAGISLLCKDRAENEPFVCAGGPCAYNPEPLADYIDIFMVGDGEENLPELINKLRDARDKELTRAETLRYVSDIEGVYIPAFYEPVYDGDMGVILEYRKLWDGAPDRVRRAIVHDLDKAVYPTANLVSTVEAVHDRAVVETFRGCTRGCRFCQAGMIYRPIREREKSTIMDLVKKQLDNTGHDELSILSLSTSDYSDFEGLATNLMDYCSSQNTALSLPSLRLDNFSFNVLNEIQKYKKSGLTFAPEAGTQRLRDVINKGVKEEDIYNSMTQAIELGWNHIKLYFMDGLPTETYEDLDGIADIAKKILDIRYGNPNIRGRFNITVSVSNFVPKAHTPFQWMAQDTEEVMRDKHDYLVDKLKIRGVKFAYHDSPVSKAEAIFARGDRRCGDLLRICHEHGCKLDAWTEGFDKAVWDECYEEWNMDPNFYTHRERSYEEILPWDIIDSGIRKEFLINECEKSKRAETTHDCRYGCVGCGINRYTECKLGGIYG